ncbi:H-NS family nucleoid-associated regulatory protein [Leptospira interrogans]
MSKVNGLDAMSCKQLAELRDRVAATIASRKSAEKAEVKRKLAELAAKSGIDLMELISGKAPRKTAKVKAKYRNPTDPSQTWAGCGRQPRWLVAALKKGQKLDSFRI